MKRISILLLAVLLFTLSLAQVSQFPQVYYYGADSGNPELIIHSSNSSSSSAITELSLTAKIGADALFTNSSDPYEMNWVRVSLPSTSSSNNSPNYGYLRCNEFYGKINSTNNYATVNTTSTPLGVRTCAGCTSTYVTSGGQSIWYGKNSILALTGSTSSGWYEIYLPNGTGGYPMAFSQPTGWVNGQYLSFPSSQSYKIIGGRVCNGSGNCTIIGNVNQATITYSGLGTTRSGSGSYEYKVPTNWNGTLTCSHPSYNSSSPASYSISASSNNYSKHFILSNCTTPNAPTISSCNGANANSFTANWSSVSGATNYYLDVSTNSSFSSFVSGYNNLNVGNVITKSVTGLNANTTYYYRVRVYTCALSSNSSYSSCQTTTSCTTPNAPTISTCSGANTNSFTANWSSVSGATKYYLDVSTNSSFSSFVSGYNNLDVGNVITKSVTGLSANTTYYYRVRVYTCALSANSSYSTCQTTTSCTTPNAPTISTCSGANTNSFTANWSTVAGATNYYLDVSTNSSFSSFVSGYNNLDVGNVITKSVTGLNANTTYYYRVRVYTCALSANSGIQNCATLTNNNGTISGTILCQNIKNINGDIQNNNVSVTVNLYNAGSTTVLQTISSSNGSFLFTNLSLGNFDVEVVHNYFGRNFKTKETNIVVNTSDIELKLSSKVFEQISNYNQYLEDLTCYLNEIAEEKHLYPSYNMNTSNSYISDNISLRNNDNQQLEALLRLAMAERMLVNYYEQARGMTEEFVMSADEFAHTVFNLVKIFTCDPNSTLMEGLVEFAIDGIAEAVKVPVYLSSSPNKIYFIGAIDGVADGLKTKGRNFEISPQTIYNSQKRWIHPWYMKNSLSRSYVDPTLSLPSNITNLSETGQFVGNIQNTISSNNLLLQNSSIETAVASGWAQGLRDNPDWIEFLGELATSTACSNLLSKIASVGYNGANILLLSGSIFKSVKRTFQLSDEVYTTSLNSYNRIHTDDNANNFNITLHNQRLGDITNAVNDFEMEYQNTIDEISLNNYVNLSGRITTLISLNNIINQSVRDELFGIKSALPYSVIPDSMYLNSIQHSVISSPLTRSGHLIALSYFSKNLDLTDIKDSIIANSMSVYAYDASMIQELDGLGNVLDGINSPAYIVVKESNIPLIGLSGNNNPINLILKNYGSNDASNVYILIESDGVAQFSTDSIYVGSLNANEEKILSFNLISPMIEDTLSFYNILIYGDSINAESKGGTTSSTSKITNIKNDVERKIKFSIYPNPNNGLFIVEFESLNNENEITIVNNIGQQVYFEKLSNSIGIQTKEIKLNNLPKGIYNIQIKSGRDISIQKIVIN